MLLSATIVVTLLAGAVVALYYYLTRNFKYWKQQGVTYEKPLPIFGSQKDVFLQKISVGHYLKKVYDDYKAEPYVGIYSFDQPALVVRDLEIVKNVLVKDAQNFSDHVISFDKDLDPLGSRNLFAINGQRWKHMRNAMSPTFTSGKMKSMFYLVERCASELDKYLDQTTADGSPVEIKCVASRYTTDAIAACAFGLDVNAFKDPNSEFSFYLNKVFQFDTLKSAKAFVAIFMPKLLTTLRLQLFDPKIYDFVRRTFWSTIKYREDNGIVRKDFLDSMRELQKKMEADSDNAPFKMENDDYVGQAFSFLTAGFETSSTTMSFALYELALHPEIQSRLRTEILEVLQNNNNEVTYDAILQMKYLDMVVNETLRRYPVLPFLDRNCLTDYKIPAATGKGTVTIPAGTGVYISLLGIHYNPEYYPEPHKFNPDNFSDENKQNRPNYTHMPFGEGPRLCIGMRFGLMQTKTGLIHILSRYEVVPCKETQIPLVLDDKTFLMSSKGGITLSFNKIKT